MQGSENKLLIFFWGNSFHTINSILASLIEGEVTMKQAGPLYIKVPWSISKH